MKNKDWEKEVEFIIGSWVWDKPGGPIKRLKKLIRQLIDEVVEEERKRIYDELFNLITKSKNG